MRGLTLALFSLSAVLSQAATLSLDPKATYLRTNNDGGALSSTPVSLASLGIGVGDQVEFTRLGSLNNGNNVTIYGLSAVFSSSATLLGGSNLNRVSGAIDAGTDFASPVTYHGSLTTDIAEDFRIGTNDGSVLSATVFVPVGATHIFFSSIDSYFGDNSSSTFGVEIEAVPEPATLAALGLGIAALKRRKK